MLNNVLAWSDVLSNGSGLVTVMGGGRDCANAQARPGSHSSLDTH